MKGTGLGRGSEPTASASLVGRLLPKSMARGLGLGYKKGEGHAIFQL